MDSLLKGKPTQLTNERREMFELIDRFSASVYEYIRQYLSTIDKRDKDLQQRRTDKDDTLKRLRAMQSDQQKKALNEHNNAIESIDRQISDCQSRANTSIREQEEQLNKFESGEKTSLTAAYNVNERNIRGYRQTRDAISHELTRIEALLGNTISGISKLKKICDSFEPNKMVITTQTDALNAVDSAMIGEAELLYEKIKDITESLPKRVIFNRKRTSYIKSLVEMKEASQDAVIWLEGQSRKEQELRKKKSDDNCIAERKRCNQCKQTIIYRRDDSLKALREKRDAEMKRYRDLLAKMQKKNSDELNEQEKYHESQITNTSRKWQAELVNCNDSFAAMMEEKYPADRLNAWMKLFWYHPRKVEDYGKVKYVQMNTLIGVASIDISEWYSGETGVVIKNVLARYPLLFGPDRNSATHAYKEAEFVVPYSISLEEGTSLLISYDDASDEKAKSILNAVGMRLLRTAPPCQMRFQLIDADGIGAFGRLMALDPAAGNNPSEPIVKSFAIGDGGQVHSTKEDIAKQIYETKITMDDLSRQLTNYSSIREFNFNNPLSRQIYRPILMMNFPLGLGYDQIRTLNSMVSHCSKWGFSMVLAQPDKALQTAKPEIQSAVKDLQLHLLCLRMDGNNQGLKVETSESHTEKKANIRLFGIPDSAVIPCIAREIRRESVDASRMLIRFTDAKGVFPDKSEWFNAKADDGIVIPVGYLEGGQPFKLQFDDKHVHTVIMGNTGSGKTNLLHVLMTNTMLRYSPDEVMIYLIDFKYGLDFRMYTQFNLPNFRTISINNDPEFALAMLQNLEKEQEDRSIRMGSRFQKISEYNAANPQDHLNRIILIVDELYELAKQASDDVQKSILKKIDSFAHQTRAFGIHMVVSGQDLDKIENFETIKNQCTTRLALHCGDDQVKMLMDDAGVARMHTIDSNDQGACVFSLSGGSNPQIEHTTYLGAEQQEKVLGVIHQHYLDKKCITGVKVLLTKVSDNPNHILQMFVSNGHVADLGGNRLVIGEPITMERELNLRPTGNLWLIGGSSGSTLAAMDAGNSIMFFSAMSLMISKIKYKNIEILCTNCCDEPMRDIEEEEKDLFGQLTSMQDKYFKYSKGDKVRETMDVLLEQLSKRKANRALCDNALWWLVVRPELTDGKLADSDFVIGLKELLLDGPKVNIHTILWNADVKAAQKFQIEKTLFKDRICLEMTSEESKIVNGGDLKKMPEGFKALLIGNNTMRFRAYDLPDGMWMNTLFSRIKSL